MDVLGDLIGIVYALVTGLRKPFQKLVGRWADRPAARKVRGTRAAAWFVVAALPVMLAWKVIRCFGEHDHIVQHPDGTIGPIRVYTWTLLGRDLRRIASRLMSSPRG